jgi:hypothetical protein
MYVDKAGVFNRCVRKATEGNCMKNTPETRPSNVTPFVLEGRWALHGLDQPTMRWLSRVAKRKRVRVADVIYEAIDSFVAKCEAHAELETKIIKFPTSLKR